KGNAPHFLAVQAAIFLLLSVIISLSQVAFWPSFGYSYWLVLCGGSLWCAVGN
ncbi:hypothetical protein BDR26DRAFT_867909, partial [Obelidium mucronatum]